jgi:hypothetical protein
MTPREFRAYCRFAAMAEERLDRRTAQLCLIFASGNLTRKDGRPFTFEDFLPQPQQSKSTYNGHSDRAADMREFRATVRGMKGARLLAEDDPRGRVDKVEIERYRSNLNGR